jgi:hypothetical protein
MLVYFAGLTCGAELMLKVHVLMWILEVAQAETGTFFM